MIYTNQTLCIPEADTHIKNLRKDLGPSGEMIKTVRGVGYCLRKV